MTGMYLILSINEMELCQACIAHKMLTSSTVHIKVVLGGGVDETLISV